MRTIVNRSVIPILLAATAACARQSGDAGTALSDDLRRDLEAASSASVELASSGAAPVRFVSAIERAGGEPERRATPAPRSRVKRPVPKPARVAEEPEAVQEEVEVAEASVIPEPETVAPAVESVEESSAPALSVRPSPMSVSLPADVGRGEGDRGMGAGEIIGVIIRGGNGGIDDCAAHDRRRGRGRGTIASIPVPIGGGGILVNDPIRIGRPTFPRR